MQTLEMLWFTEKGRLVCRWIEVPVRTYEIVAIVLSAA